MIRLLRGLLGWLWWVALPVRRATAWANLQEALPQGRPADLRRAVGIVAVGYLEMIVGRRPRVVGVEHLPPGGGVALMGHGGAWDLSLVEMGHHAPVTVFVKTPSSPTAARFIRRHRERAGLELLGTEGTMERAYAALEEGRLVIFFVDQRHNTGVPVPFFGRPAWTSPAFASMVWRKRPPVVGLWPTVDAAGRHVLQITPVPLTVPDDRDDAIASLTTAAQAWVEAQVRRAPGAWWWLHRRWRVPPGQVEPTPGGGMPGR